jgi:diaminohydroxyphosphoribosylaminopyrimidine deaminase/5-amino-6-(5-phosphoribosylamino)uracil reductase
MTRFATDDEAMRYALRLAERGVGYVEPNPAVGAVVVSDVGELVGTGYHERFGGPHAEVNALREAGERARGATLYCTLEPCSHFGKTPPCAPLVVSSGVRRVVVAMGDPAPHVSGRGFELIRRAGIELTVGVCVAEAQRLTAPFVTLMTQGRPYVHAKWAMTLDGRIATRTGHSQWISNERSREVVHQLRGRMDAILIGVGTVLSDDPLLTARPPGPRTALRVVVDSQLRTPMDSQLVQTARDIPLLIATTSAAKTARADELRESGAEVFALGEGPRVDLTALMKELGRRKLTNLLVEGGGEVLGGFRDADLIDEYHVFLAPKIAGGGAATSPIGGKGRDRIPEMADLTDFESQMLDGDVYLRGRTRRE